MWMQTQGFITKAQGITTNNALLQGVCVCVCVCVCARVCVFMWWISLFLLLQCSPVCVPPTSVQSEIYIISDTTKHNPFPPLTHTHTHTHNMKTWGKARAELLHPFQLQRLNIWFRHTDTILCGSWGCSPGLNVKLYNQVNDLSGNRKTPKTLASLTGGR